MALAVGAGQVDALHPLRHRPRQLGVELRRQVAPRLVLGGPGPQRAEARGPRRPSTVLPGTAEGQLIVSEACRGGVFVRGKSGDTKAGKQGISEYPPPDAACWHLLRWWTLWPYAGLVYAAH